jgi:hypothetical protein
MGAEKAFELWLKSEQNYSELLSLIKHAFIAGYNISLDDQSKYNAEEQLQK